MTTMASPWKHPDSGIYYHRIEVPKDIRDVIGKAWIKSSLRTRDYAEAKRKFALKYAETMALFKQARERVSLTDKDIEVLAQRWFVDALREIEEDGKIDHYVLRSADGEFSHVSELVSYALESGYTQQHKWVGHFVRNLLMDNNLSITEGSREHQGLTEKLCWRFLELSRIALDRYGGDWSRPDSRFTERAQESLSFEATKQTERDYKPLSEVVDAFIDFKTHQGDWEPKTKSDAVGVCSQLVEFLGPDTNPSSVTREQLREFSSLLGQLPKNYSRTPSLKYLSLQELLDIAVTKKLPLVAPSTVSKKFKYIKSLFKHAALEEWVDRDRAVGITFSKNKDQQKKREPLLACELLTLFKATKDAKRPSDYWLPRISLTTGMRSNEILQLTVADVRQAAGVWCFDVNTEAGKKTKNQNSVRLVPVPEVLITTGFLDFVQGVGSGRLFPCVEGGINGDYSRQYSKRINTLLGKLGLKPDAQAGILKDFHSLRHTFRANCRSISVSQETADLIGGWRDQDRRTAGDNYGLHYESFISELKAAVDSIEYGDLFSQALRRSV